MKFFNIQATDEAGLVHAHALLVNEKVAALIIEDCLANLVYQAPRLNIQIGCVAESQ